MLQAWRPRPVGIGSLPILAGEFFRRHLGHVRMDQGDDERSEHRFRRAAGPPPIVVASGRADNGV
ncbi:MAG TPA: hypothetical protein VE198_16610 [Actinoallomurus sp.]|jgi:hypothetical protein|nr:hypothetical protein [Actinoallomurus sp.]